MLNLVLSILCSVMVGVIFKLSRRYDTNNLQIVGFNYLIALLFCFVVFSPDLTAVDASAPFLVYGSLGVLLPIVFLCLITSIAKIGIVKTDAAQRLSLFIPILAAWLIFEEQFSTTKIIGIAIGFLALFFIVFKSKEAKTSNWNYPLLVFVGFGIIDILFKKVAVYTVIPYTTSLFIVFAIALLMMIVIIGVDLFFKKKTLTRKTILFGFLVGLFNFGNILFYLKAHKAFAENPSTVFAGMNMGVIILGSLVGVLAFKERLSKVNYLGLVLALFSIIIIVIAQLSQK